MSLLERYEQQAVVLPGRAGGVPEDLIAQLVDERRTWKQIDQCIRDGGNPTALFGGMAGLEGATPPSTKDETLVTGGATELAIFPSASCAIPANAPGSKMWVLWASGTSTTAATPGTYNFRPRIGNSNASPAIGATTGNLTPVASATAASWNLTGWVYVRMGAGTAGTAVGSFEFNHSGTIGGGGPVSATGNAVFGGTASGIDWTLSTNGLWMGVVHATSTTNQWTAQFVGWGSMNG